MIMPQSMTGYGRGQTDSFKVEIRSSNHKNIDISVNLPYYLFSHEPEIKKIVKNKFNRGRIEIFIPKQEIGTVKMKVNKSLAREYFNALTSLKEELSISDNVGIEMVASQRDIFLLDEQEIDSNGLYSALETALEELSKSRSQEGSNLVKDINERVRLVQDGIAAIEQKREEFASSAKEKLMERLREFLGEIELDEIRLIQEAAVMIERSDITEEIVRIHSHLKHFEEVLKSDDSIGKKMDFILQELRREINTIGSKAQNYGISNKVVDVKHELEKIREQVQNLQ